MYIHVHIYIAPDNYASKLKRTLAYAHALSFRLSLSLSLSVSLSLSLSLSLSVSLSLSLSGDELTAAEAPRHPLWVTASSFIWGSSFGAPRTQRPGVPSRPG